MFSKGTANAAKRKFKNLLQISDEAFNERYLGLPIHLGRSKTKAFGYLKEKVWRKIQGWKEKFLSRAGKEILIKAVAQAIPLFAMSCFDITKRFCDDIGSMVCRYWWNNQEEERHHWLGWQCLSKPKVMGASVLGISISLIWACWPGRAGDSCRTLIRWWEGFCVQNTFLMAVF